jgi:hypothetical protein
LRSEDFDWHGYGDCVEITYEMLDAWEREAEEDKLPRHNFMSASEPQVRGECGT